MSREVLISVVIGLLTFGLVLFVFFAPRLWTGRVVAAVYRRAFATAQDLGGLDWLQSPDGIAYRKILVRRAYAILPSPFFGVPWKLLISEAIFISAVQVSFDSAVTLAAKLAADPNAPELNRAQ